MVITKRNGKTEKLKFDKIQSRVKKLTYDLDTNYIDADEIAVKVTSGLYEGVTTKELDTLASEVAFGMATKHPDYSYLASRLAITSLYKEDEIEPTFSKSIEKLYEYVNPLSGENAGIISKEIYDFVMKNRDILDNEIIKDRDFLIDYFGFKTLERAYLIKRNGKVAETPQYMWMRVACGVWGGINDLDNVLKTYNFMSQKYFTHATPTLFNAGTNRPQLSSCFLLTMNDDSIKGIYKTLSDVAQISKYAGGIGISVHDIRAKGSYIKGTNGTTDGLVPMLRVFNETARYVNQAGKRKGSFAIYLEPSHADIEDFLKLRTNTGKEELKARDLFTAVWTPDLFFDRVQKDEDWTLFSPDIAKNLSDVYGDEYVALYTKYEEEGLGVKTIKAKELYEMIDKSRIETGTPYIMAKDACNEKSNQKNLGTIKSSNLCSEIVEYTSPDETAVCNLASIAVNMFVEQKVKNKKPEYNFDKLYEVTYQAAINLDRVIDVNFYPTIEGENSNKRHRPIGIGSQGLADCFALMDLAFDSNEAKQLNKDIFETMYYAALKASNDLAKTKGKYSTFDGSPASKGILQFDMWEDRTVEKQELLDSEGNPILDSKGNSIKDWVVTESKPITLSGRWDFDSLKEDIVKYGLSNSLSLAPMPTASCQVIDSEILTSKGKQTYRQILEEQSINYESIVDEDKVGWVKLNNTISVQTRHGFKETDLIYYNGIKPLLEIEMEDGTVFKVTENHKFLVDYDKYVDARRVVRVKWYRGRTKIENPIRWIPAEELKEGMVIKNIFSGDMKIKSIKKGDLKPTWDIHVPNVEEYVMSNGCVSHNTSQILGNTESFQPFNRNIYKRETLAGQFTIVNHHLVKDLCKLNLWNEELKNKIIMNEGSIQEIDGIPENIKEKYKVVWDIKQKDLIDMSADRGAFVCQSQSFNLFIKNISFPKLKSATLYGWKKGLKTISYYVHTITDVTTNKSLGVDTSSSYVKEEVIVEDIEPKACSLDDPDCLACSA